MLDNSRGSKVEEIPSGVEISKGNRFSYRKGPTSIVTHLPLFDVALSPVDNRPGTLNCDYLVYGGLKGLLGLSESTET